MKKRPEVSDEEIQSYMDFDRLLAQRKVFPGRSTVYKVLRYTVPVVAVTGVVLWLLLSTSDDHKQVANNPEAVSETTILPPETEPVQQAETRSPAIQEKKTPVEKTTVKGAIAKADVASTSPAETALPENIYTQAEPQAGYQALYNYFNAQLVYPLESVRDSIEGVETVTFIINADGRPEAIQVQQSLGMAFELEAKRLIQNMPLWKPATLNGKAVPSKMSLPLTFQIKNVTPKKKL